MAVDTADLAIAADIPAVAIPRDSREGGLDGVEQAGGPAIGQYEKVHVVILSGRSQPVNQDCYFRIEFHQASFALPRLRRR